MIDYDDFIVPNGFFKWREYALLREWGKLATPTDAQRNNAILLFRYVRDLIRVPLGEPLTLSSGARTAEYVAYLRSKGIPAALHGAHNDWAAGDFLPPASMTNAQFWHWCDKRWPGRMEKLESTPKWVHLDTRQWGERVRFNP